ncbi:MAG TPA: RDD family protein [Candidatus Kapabacteria bacterium]|nr:RDD family protein [Candidatus Kapabacteria bacterium]HRT67599.1 RDD family protein [Bacteroidota bacterium]
MQDSNKYKDQEERLKRMLPQYGNQFSLNDFRVGFYLRAAASIIDFMFKVFILTIVIYATGMYKQFIGLTFADMMDPEFINHYIRTFVPLSFVIYIIYNSMDVFFAGTPGKHILGIIIADEKMKYASYSKLLYRFLMKNLDLVFQLIYILTWLQVFSTISSIVSFIILFAFLFTLGENKQALYDSIAKTAVYYKRELKEILEKNNIQN